MTFLSNTDTGLLVNRYVYFLPVDFAQWADTDISFSQDMRLIDMVLPAAFISTAFRQSSFRCHNVIY